MPGRLQKVAALIFAACAFAPFACVAESHGFGGIAGSNNIEIAFKRHLPLGIEAKVSMFRARSEDELTFVGATAITPFTRPMLRQGVHANARYEPYAWLALDFHGMELKSRFADGAAEDVFGAPQRAASAAGTLRMPAGWSASLALNYLSKRSGIDGTLPVPESTFANGRLAHDLSRTTRVSLDFANMFGQKLHDADYFLSSRTGPSQDALFNPAEPRGVRLGFKTTF